MKEIPLSDFTACTFFSNARFRHSLLDTAIDTFRFIATISVGVTHLATSGTGGSPFTSISAMTKSLTFITPQRVRNID